MPQVSQIKIGHILDMQVGAELFAAEHLDAAGIDCMIGEDIDRKIQPEPRRVPANCGGPQNNRDEAGLMLPHQYVFTQSLVFRVIGQWLQRQILGDLRLVFDSVDGG